MNLKFVFFALLLVSAAFAQQAPNPSATKASCIRETLGKLSQEGKVHAFGIRVTTENNIKMESDKFWVGARTGEKAITASQIADPSKETVEPQREFVDKTTKISDLSKVEKNPLTEVIDGNTKIKATQESMSFVEKAKVVEKLVQEQKMAQVVIDESKKKIAEASDKIPPHRLVTIEHPFIWPVKT